MARRAVGKDLELMHLTRPVGRGRITYIGAIFDDNLMRTVVRWLAQIDNLTPAFGLVPKDVEVCPREDGQRQIFVILNHSKEETSVNLPHRMQNVLTGETRSGHISLPSRGVVVLEDIIQ
jgi:beta-galactosidase